MSGSKGLQRYVPRILQDSGMIAASEVAHYTHLSLAEYVKADDHDAALCTAKVEALREMKTELTSQSGTSAWDVVSYIEARIVELELKITMRQGCR